MRKMWKKDATESVPLGQHNYRQSPCPSVPINEIGKRVSNSFEYALRFILRPMESSSDPRFGRTNDPTSPFRAVGFHLLHARTGKHSFRAPDRTATRADVNRADRTRRLIYERDDPHRLAALIRAKGVTGGRKTRMRFFRRMTCHRIRTAGI